MTAGPCFEKNIQALRNLNPKQADTITSLTPKVFARLYGTSKIQEGFSNFSIKSDQGDLVSLFQTDQPAHELSAWVASANQDWKSVHAIILLGFGLGYEAKELLQHLPHHAIVAIVEPDPIQFFTALHYVDITDLLDNKKVHFYVGQSIEKAVEGIGTELQWPRFLNLPYHILATSLMQRTRPSFAKQFSATWRDALQRELMYRQSRIAHGETVVIHTLANAEAILNYPGMSTLFHHFEGIPAVLAAAGPSLEKVVESLRNIQHQTLIACVNSAYPVLRKHGITPHLVFTMDHHERNIQSFQEDTPSPETFLVADPRIHPRIIHHFHPRVFLASWRSTTETIGQPAPLHQVPVPQMSGNALYLWLQTLAGNKGDVYGPGSVAVVGFHMLARLGCKPVILAGQDLAFTDEKVYSNGTIFDDPSLPRDHNASHTVPSVDGGSVGTSETLHLYRRLLEHEIARFNIPVFNTSSGAVIHGSITTRIESLRADLPEAPLQIAGRLESLLHSYTPQADTIDLRKALEQAVEEIQAFADQARSAIDLVPPELEIPLCNDSSLLQQLEQTISSLNKTHALELLNELLQGTYFEFEDHHWKSLLQTDENKIRIEKIHNQVRILDAFIRQAGLMISLMEEKMVSLD